MFKLHSGLATGLSINDPGNVCAGARLCESVHPLVITLYARLYCLLQSLCAFPYIASLYSAVFECGVFLLQLPALDRTHKQQCVRTAFGII